MTFAPKDQFIQFQAPPLHPHLLRNPGVVSPLASVSGTDPWIHLKVSVVSKLEETVDNYIHAASCYPPGGRARTMLEKRKISDDRPKTM